MKHQWLLAAALIITALVYWPGLHGAFIFDDYPNIVDNHGVQPQHADFASLVRAALSSPSSSFKRPLASLTFAANYLASGLDPYWMKFTNLIIHLLNGLLAFLLARELMRTAYIPSTRAASPALESLHDAPIEARIGTVAALLAAGWMLLPINLTGVLYVVQRMESMANLFVMLGLLGYVIGRRRMLGRSGVDLAHAKRFRGFPWDFLPCLLSITIPTAIGLLAKETAVMLPLYAVLIEWILFRFQRNPDNAVAGAEKSSLDRRIVGLFLLVLAAPMVAGLAWIVPGLLNPETWSTRDFTLTSRLLSEARIVTDYVAWTLLPSPHALSFYHDDFRISEGVMSPWSTLACMVFLSLLAALVLLLRRRLPLVSLGIALYLGCHLLTGTIIPLELIYEHRNYFASFGLLLAVIPLLAAPPASTAPAASTLPPQAPILALPMAVPRYALLSGLLICWTLLTASTAYSWGDPLRLAEDLAQRAPASPRAQYELGRTYIIYSHYDPDSPFNRLAYAALEKSAKLPDSSILPEQALIFMNARMHLPLRREWWQSMVAKLRAHKPSVQDESSLGALVVCARQHLCSLPSDRMVEAFLAALSHPDPSARLLASYGDYAWNVMDDHSLGENMTREAVKASPGEPAYRVTLIRMLAVQGESEEARSALKDLESMNIGGSLDKQLAQLRALPGLR